MDLVSIFKNVYIYINLVLTNEVHCIIFFITIEIGIYNEIESNEIISCSIFF